MYREQGERDESYDLEREERERQLLEFLNWCMICSADCGFEAIRNE